MFFWGCGDERTNPNQVNSASFQYPHSRDWDLKHIPYLVSEIENEGEINHKKCLDCHSNQKEVFSLGSSVACGASCHASSDGPNNLDSRMNLNSRVAETSNACGKCHKTQSELHSHSHYPAIAGLCSICHQANPAHLDGSSKKEVQTLPAEKSCYLCHFKNDGGPVHHSALTMGEKCANCHSVHGGNLSMLLKSTVQDLCTTCHDSINLHANVIHGPIKTEKSCSTCHLPHGSKSPKLLSTETQELCSKCHAQSLTDGNLVHQTPLQIKNCTTCHNAHASEHKALLPQEPRDFCLSCHNKEIVSSGNDSRKIENIAEKLKSSPFAHGPATTTCASKCHTPHATKFPLALTANYSVATHNDFAANPTSYDLCFQCHKRALLSEEISAPDTEFRADVMENGKLKRKNLHWFHVVNGGGSPNWGRSCSTCHDPHAAAYVHKIRSFFKMKNYAVTIDYQATNDGGTCARSCHGPKSYQRLPDQP